MRFDVAYNPLQKGFQPQTTAFQISFISTAIK
jgi:hypothetical protein